jgi:Lytic transglycolase
VRPKFNLRRRRLAYAGLGASVLVAIPATAAALTSTSTHAQAAPSGADPLQIGATPHNVAFGQDVKVNGTAASADAGHKLTLQFAPAPNSSWRALTTTTVGANGGFRLTAALRRSGWLRVLDATADATANVVGQSLNPLAPAAGPVAVSSSRYVAVAAELSLSDASFNVLSGHAIDVRGRLLPAAFGRQVRLQGRSGRAWRTLATAPTGSRGRFDLHYVTGTLGQVQLRVRFPGDLENAPTSTPVGQLIVYRQSVASWYDDAGETACGFHAYFGVANKVLPCGTKVTFRYNGRTVTATVQDRGPFIAGREWDLNQNTAAALGFTGVDTVWSTI